MNTAYVYLQLYKLFDSSTPLSVDCGQLCKRACCKGEGGMYLFPGEKKVYELLNPNWIKISKSDFSYTSGGKRRTVYFAECCGECDRFQRPLACRIFPLTPVLSENGKIKIITDPRAKAVCPLSKAMHIDEYNDSFVKNTEKAFKMLMNNRQFADFMKSYTDYINEYRKFFSEND